MLVDFVLGVGSVRVGVATEEMAEAEEVGNKAGDDRDGVAVVC